MKKHNFNAGPSILPREVIEKTAQAVLDFNGEMEGVGRVSYDRLLSNLQLAGVVDESLEQILSGRSDR